MSTNKKIKTENNNKIFKDLIDFEILKSLINYLLISKINKTNNHNNNGENNYNNNNTNNQYKINKFYLNRNEILNYILVSKKWYNFISLTISNNIINNKSFEHWLKINYNNNKSFIQYYNNQNQYDKNNILFYKKGEKKHYKISLNKKFSIIKIKESIIDNYFKFNLFLDKITIDDFKEIKNKFENNQLLYNRIVVNFVTSYDKPDGDYTLFRIHGYILNENSEIISNLFKILELNYDFWLRDGYGPNIEDEDDDEDDDGDGDDDDVDDEGNNKFTELYLNNLSISGNYRGVDEDKETVKIFKIFKALFDPNNSQQAESIKVQFKIDMKESVEARHLIKVNQFENLHSIAIPINSFQILSNLSEEMGFIRLYKSKLGNSKNMKSELYQMVNSIITCKSLKNLKITSVNLMEYPIDYEGCFDGGDDDYEVFANKINENIEYYSNCFQPLFSELNTTIERIVFDCMGLLNINTFSNLLNNKSINYLYLYNDSDFIVYSSKQSGRGYNQLHLEPISINQYLFDNIFSSPLTSIRHYKIRIKKSKQFKFIFNLILNNIFKLQLYSLTFKINKDKLVGEFVKEFKNFINNISKQQQQQQQKSNNINLKEIKIKTEINDEYIQELNNINNPYFITVIKKLSKW
ncbi:hypothetical protein ACTFIR_012028 [Dictyostelium discoideum]